jgi:hypothetical protein
MEYSPRDSPREQAAEMAGVVTSNENKISDRWLNRGMIGMNVY